MSFALSPRGVAETDSPETARTAAALGAPSVGAGARSMYIFDLLRALVGRDIKVRYRRSILGVFWSLVNPVLHLIVFVFVFQWVAPLNIPNYPLFTFTGGLAWWWFCAALPAATGSITGNRELIRQPGFPAGILPVVSVLSTFVHFAIAMTLVLGVLLVSGAGLSRTVVALPLVAALQFLLTLSVGYITAAIQVRFRDMGYLIGVLLFMGLFVTPVFYRPDLAAAYYPVYLLNPMAHVIAAYRDVLIEGRWPNFPSLLIVGAATTLVLGLAFRIFTRVSVEFADEA
jgi:lipopolysaccharide transport system permease protein